MSRLPLLVLAIFLLPLGLVGASSAAADDAPSAVEIPSVIGKSEAEARAALEARGLLADVTYVEDTVAPAGTVISQDPKSGTEILSGATIQLRVIGPAPDGPEGPAGGDAPPEEPVDQVTMPTLPGLLLKDAEAALLALGLTPRPNFVQSDAAPAFHVLTQEIAAGTLLPTSTHIRFDVALGAEAPTALLLPSLYGLGEADALAVLGQLGLDASIVRVTSNLPQGMVFFQQPVAGTEVAAGDTIQVRVADAPPVDWTPTLAVVPSLQGLSSDQARIALLVRGLRSRMRRGLKPNANVHRVYQQNRPAGSQVTVGTRVTFYLPYKALVPNVIGKTKASALATLSAASLQGHAIGPNFGLGITKVNSQSRPAGSTVARGSLIKFNYTFQAVLIKVQVPSVVGLTKLQAKQKIEAKGLVAKLLALPGGFGVKKIVAQFPAPGIWVNKGSMVTAKYKGGGFVLIKVNVPNVIGLSKIQAQQKIQAKGLTANMVALPGGFGIKKVVSQSPAAGTLVLKGSTVTAKYKGGGFVLIKVNVPNVIGLSKIQAQQKIQAKGLTANMVALAGGFGIKKVVTQFPAAGTLVLKGSTVTAKYKGGGFVLIKVAVPNVIGLSKIQAQQKIQAKGLTANMVALAGGFGIKKVVSQSPAAGTLVLKGSTVTAKYKGGGLILTMTKVPNLIGKTKAQAKAALAAKGLKWKFVQFGFKVKTQSKPANATVLKGTTITMKMGI